MNIDELKSDWRNIDACYVTDTNSEIEKRVMQNKVASLGRKFCMINMRMITLCGIGIAMVIPLAEVNLLLMGLIICYYITFGLILFFQARSARKINLCDMSAVEALEAVCRLEKARIMKRRLGVCLALPLLGYLTYVIYLLSGLEAMYICLAAGVAGAVIGLVINHRTSKILTEMKSALDT